MKSGNRLALMAGLALVMSACLSAPSSAQKSEVAALADGAAVPSPGDRAAASRDPRNIRGDPLFNPMQDDGGDNRAAGMIAGMIKSASRALVTPAYSDFCSVNCASQQNCEAVLHGIAADCRVRKPFQRCETSAIEPCAAASI